ncbi:MAG: PA0069 family radical SAM protein [Verrucomicrobiota bacterium]
MGMDSGKTRSYRGRAAGSNPRNRFEKLEFEWDEDLDPEERPSPKTVFLDDVSQSIISYNSSPDLPFSASVNPYRGCEHGCAYCYARPTHEYLGYSAGLDFESKIMVKREAPALLRKELAADKWTPHLLAMSGVTDCYQPVEGKLEITRGCLEVLLEARNPVGIVTKNRMVVRDKDLLSEMAKRRLGQVILSINSLDTELAREMEPRTSSPRGRLEAIRELSDAGVPVGVLLAPVVPGLNDHEIPKVLEAVHEAGAMFAGYVLLRLPYGNKELFFDWVKRAYPRKADKVENRVRACRGGSSTRLRLGSE